MMQQAVLTQNETDDGKPKALPERTCIVTRQVRPISELIRFVAAPDGALVPDLNAVLPGRGVWVGADKQSVQRAVSTKAFQAALKSNVTAHADLPEKTGKLLKERALQALAMANKGGDVICGMAKIETALEGRPIALIHAADGSDDGSEKLNRRFRAICGPGASIFTLFLSEDLDMAFGRSNVIHAALTEGRAARAALKGLQRLLAYEAGITASCVE